MIPQPLSRILYVTFPLALVTAVLLFALQFMG